MSLRKQKRQSLSEALAASGLRLTKQREHILSILMEQKDHPSADQIYARAKPELPGLSLATVYNCLDTLVSCGLVRQIHFQRQPSRYCPVVENDHHFAHFHCQATGKVFDIDLPDEVVDSLVKSLPEGFAPEKMELCFSGRVDKPSPSIPSH